VRAVHQLLSYLYGGDGMGNHALALQRLFRSWGLDAKIFASYVDSHPPRDCHPSAAFLELTKPGDVAILHYGTYSPQLELFSRASARRVLAYHNITPPRFFVNHALRHYYETALGRLQLPQAVRVAEQCWTESAYNKGELDVVEAKDARVVPLLLELEALDSVEPDADVLSRYADGTTNVISVGRIVPNKRQDRVISAFVRYHREFNTRSRLLLVGRHDEVKPYCDELRAHAKRLQAEHAVVFTGHVTAASLVAHYRTANVLVCLSEHEGFGVPLVEAMHFGVPVIALATAAVPETLGGAGVLVADVDATMIAAAIHRVCSDRGYRARLLEAQRRRLKDFDPARVAGMLRQYLEELDR
jgi:glycosyltransferase involved in cell wall biosynthesis